MSRQDAIDSMVRTLWVLAWADHIEEYPDSELAQEAGSLAGVDIMEVAPDEIPVHLKEEADGIANGVYEGMKKAWGVEPWEAVVETAKWRQRDDPDAYLNNWAHYTLMEALGHGVGWSDHEEPILKYPSKLAELLSAMHELPDPGDAGVYAEGLMI